jgi:hypothetical protein
VRLGDLVDEGQASGCEAHDDLAAVVGVRAAVDEPALGEAIDAVGDRPGRHHRAAHQHAGGEFVRRPAAPQDGEHVVHPVLELEAGEVLGEAAVDEAGQPRDPGRSRRSVTSRDRRCRPLLDDPVDGVLLVGGHAPDGRPRRLVTPARCRDG